MSGSEFRAFLSYARADDRGNPGQIIDFCQRLTAEVQMHLGNDFHIFQDLDDIRWGNDWQQRIDAAIESAVVFIPVLSPNFLASSICRRELSQFLDRERRLGRSDLVFPLHYVATPELVERVATSADPLVIALRRRQFADWRQHRLARPDAPEVRQALVGLAAQITRTVREISGHDRGRSGAPPAERYTASPRDWRRDALVDHGQLFGVEKKLADLGRWLANPHGDWIISVFGSGGVGKTTLAYEAVTRCAESAGFTRIAWISAKSRFVDGRGDLRSSAPVSVFNWDETLILAADRLAFDVDPVPVLVTEQLQARFTALPAGEKCLVVIDNLEDVADAHKVVADVSGSPLIRPHKFLLTTRESVTGSSMLVRELHWHGLPTDASAAYIDYLCKDVDIRPSHSEMQGIIGLSEGNPFIIRLVVQLAAVNRRPLGRIVDGIRDKDRRVGGSVADFLYARSIQELLERLGEDSAVGLLNCFCIKAPGDAYSAEELRQMSRIEPPEEFDAALSLACQLALIRAVDTNRLYTMHGLLREFVCS